MSNESDNRTHFVFNDDDGEHVLVVNVTDEGVIMDAFLEDEHVGTSAMMAGELFDAISGLEDA